MKIECAAILVVAFVLMMAFVVGCGTPGATYDPLYPAGQSHPVGMDFSTGPGLPNWKGGK